MTNEEARLARIQERAERRAKRGTPERKIPLRRGTAMIEQTRKILDAKRKANPPALVAVVRTAPPVIVLGCYKSGTSVLADAVATASAHPSALAHQEREDVVRLTARVLEGSPWHSAPPASWVQPRVMTSTDAKLVAQRDRIASTLTWGFKDPAAIFALDWWLAALPDAKLVGTFRHPMAVAESLKKRNGGSVANWIHMWELYAARLLEVHTARPFPIVCFDAPDYPAQVARALKSLGLSGGLVDFDPTARDMAKDFAFPPQAAIDLYGRLRAIAI